MTAAMYVPQFFVKQKITMMVNRYEVFAANPDGSQGQLLAFAEQKRMAFKEEVTFYTDSSKARKVFSFKARRAMDLNAGYDVFDDAGQGIGYFKKDFGASLMRSTFHIEGPGFAGTGQERNMVVAVLRRFSDIPFLPVHFDFKDAAGNVIMSSSRQASMRDKYTVDVPNPNVDFRFAAAMAVALDALMSR